MLAQDVAWPPASPQDVLRLTPKKNLNQSPLQPSPLRNSYTSPGRRLHNTSSHDDDDDNDSSSSSDDEEILKLKIAKIEAKLRLKELGKKKRKKDIKLNDSNKTPPRKNVKEDVQVPVSPSPNKRGPGGRIEPPPSPSRVLLGIDKGLRARDVSLRRAPGISISAPPLQPQFSAVAAAALRNATNPHSQSLTDDPFRSSQIEYGNPVISTQPQAPKSFAQRIADQRYNIQEKDDRVRKIEKSRSKAWESLDSSTNALKNTISHAPDSQVVTSRGKMGTATFMTTRTLEVNSRSTSTNSSMKENQPLALPNLELTSRPSEKSCEKESTVYSASFEPFSCLHLSRRLIPHAQLTRQLTQKALFPLTTLLKTVVSPDYESPDVTEDWVVLGIICSKSAPREVARDGAGKYMVLNLTDLKWEVELFLFGQSFEKYYKIGVGTVIAILNPGIMKPRLRDSGKFSLTLSDASDSLMEIGTARDLGGCKARKKDGKECGSWVDTRHTDFCAFHVEQSVNKRRAGRMEVNTMSKMYSPPKKGHSIRPKRSFLNGGKGGSTSGRDDGLLPEGPILDLPQRAGGAGGKVFVTTVSTAKAIDTDSSGDIYNQGDKAEKLRKHLAKLEQERDVTRKLLASQDRTHNAGVEYLRMGMSNTDTKNGRVVSNVTIEDRVFSAANVRSIGFDPTRRPGSGLSKEGDGNSAAVKDFLKDNSTLVASDVSLSPIKLKRKQSISYISTTTNGPLSPTSARAPPNKKTRKDVADERVNTREPLGWHQRPNVEQGRQRHKGLEKINEIQNDGKVQMLTKESKCVKFAPMPTVESDDEDDLEIIDWAV